METAEAGVVNDTSAAKSGKTGDLAVRGGKLHGFLRFLATLCAIVAYLVVVSKSDGWRTPLFPLIVAGMTVPVFLFSHDKRDLIALLIALVGGLATFFLAPSMGATIVALSAAVIAILVLFPWWLQLFS